MESIDLSEAVQNSTRHTSRHLSCWKKEVDLKRLVSCVWFTSLYHGRFWSQICHICVFHPTHLEVGNNGNVGAARGTIKMEGTWRQCCTVNCDAYWIWNMLCMRSKVKIWPHLGNSYPVLVINLFGMYLVCEYRDTRVFLNVVSGCSVQCFLCST